jgi:hypothetical protein
MTAFQAEFVDKKYVKTRLAYQLVFEIPAERIDEATAVLGELKGKQIWAAIARLNIESDGARDPVPPSPEKPERTPGPAPSDVPFGHRGPTDGERIRTRAVMLCKDVDFQDWIGVAASVGSTEADHEREAARELCAYLGIVSRKALADNLDAQKRFLLLEAHYHAERRGG